METPEMNPGVRGQVIFDKGDKNTQLSRIVSSTSSIGKTGYPQRIE